MEDLRVVQLTQRLAAAPEIVTASHVVEQIALTHARHWLPSSSTTRSD